MKIGESARTDSFTPRMLRVVRPTMISAASGSLKTCHSSGRKLKMASQAEAIETAIVST